MADSAGSEGSRKIGLPDILTAARYGHRLSPAAFTPQEYSCYSFSLAAESTPGPWFGRKEKNPVIPLGIDPRTIQLVAQRLNHYSNPGPVTQSLIYVS